MIPASVERAVIVRDFEILQVPSDVPDGVVWQMLLHFGFARAHMMRRLSPRRRSV